jgi:hypothetical protein
MKRGVYTVTKGGYEEKENGRSQQESEDGSFLD